MAIRLLSSETLDGTLSVNGLLTGASATFTSATINTGPGNVGLGVFTSSSSTTPNVRFGRNDAEYVGFKVEDRANRIVFRQDETTGNHEAIIDIWSSTSGNKAFLFKASDSAGASSSTWLTIENSDATFVRDVSVGRNLSVTGNITGSSGTGHFSLVNASAYQLNGTYIVDSSRNLVNIGSGNFSGGITVTGGSTGADIYINNTSPTLGFTDSNSFSDPNDIYIIRGTSGNKLQFQWYDDSASTTTETFNIDSTGNATFAGNVTTENIFQVYSTGASVVVGAVGNTANDVNIYSTTAGHNGLRMHVNGILPTDHTGTIINNDADLGDPSYRFKDLYLGGSITGVGASFIGTASSGAALVTIENNSGSTATSYGLLVKGGGNSASGKTFEVRDDSGNTDLIIKGNGNVGIGIDLPTANLHVQNASTATLKVITTGVADASVNIQGYDAGVHIGDATNGLRWAIWNDGPSTSSSLKFGSYALGTWYNDASQVVTMKSDGNVGIGTTSPLVRLQLERTVSNATSRTAPVNLIYLTSEHPSVGYTGFGTAITHYSRTYQNSTKTEQSKIAFTQQGDSVSTAGSTIDFYTKTLSTGSAAPDLRMRINYNGNVGIGTDSPKTNLEVIGGLNISTNTTSATTTTMRIGSYGASSQTYYGAKIVAHTNFGSTANTDLSFDLGGLGEVMRLHSSGSEKRVGIGTNVPSYKLEVNGGTALVGGGFYVSNDQTILTSSTYTFRDAVYINNPNSTFSKFSNVYWCKLRK